MTAPYDRIASEFGAARTRLLPREQYYLEVLLEPLTTSGVILDLGCGTGQPIDSTLVFWGNYIVGVDESSAMLALAKEQLPSEEWICAKMQEVEIDRVFDAVVCWDSLFHLDRREHAAVLKKAHRWLRPGGRLLVSSGGQVDEAPHGFTDTMFGYEFFYDSLPPEHMLALLRETGFDVVLAEMCNLPDGGRDKGKWATIAARR
jgi:SAM-dependent methyltransferase